MQSLRIINTKFRVVIAWGRGSNWYISILWKRGIQCGQTHFNFRKNCQMASIEVVPIYAFVKFMSYTG